MAARSGSPVQIRPRLLACDIDGTLLDSSGFLHPAVRDAIALISASGVEVVLATGRSPWNGVPALARSLGLAGPQITMQGALITAPGHGEVVRRQDLPAHIYLAALAFADEQGVDMIVGLLEGNRAERLPEGIESFPLAGTESAHFTYVNDLAALVDAGPLRLFLATGPGRHDAIRRGLEERFAGRASIIWSDTSGVEILRLGTDKAEALGWIAATRGIDRAEVAAVGDARNDLGMLRWAGRSAAMAAAPPEVLAAADVVVPAVGARGILGAFAWFFSDLAEPLEALGCWSLAEPVPEPA